jgi:hypothetical protein
MTIIDVFIYYENQWWDIVLKILRGITTIRYSIQDNKLYKHTTVITLKIYVAAASKNSIFYQISYWRISDRGINRYFTYYENQRGDSIL